MKPYLLALGAGLLVGIIYALLNVRSPAPPVIALIGLLGILIGEQIPPVVKRLLSGKSPTVAFVRTHSWHHVFGPLPGRADAQGMPLRPASPAEQPRGERDV